MFDPIEDAVGAGSIAGAPDKCPKPVSIAIVIRLAKKGSKEINDPEEDKGDVEVGDANVDLHAEELGQAGYLGEQARDGQTLFLAPRDLRRNKVLVIHRCGIFRCISFIVLSFCVIEVDFNHVGK